MVDQWQCWKWAGLQTLEYKARLPHYTNYPLRSPPLHPSNSHSAKKKSSTRCWFWERRQWLRALPERDRTSEMDIRIIYIKQDETFLSNHMQHKTEAAWLDSATVMILKAIHTHTLQTHSNVQNKTSHSHITVTSPTPSREAMLFLFSRVLQPIQAYVP